MRPIRAKESEVIATQLGELLQEFVNRVSHLQGRTLSVLTNESVTLQQVLLLRRLKQLTESTPSEMAERMRMSLPAVSQMIDRLFQIGLLTRTEAPDDRRRKRIAVTAAGTALLERVHQARVEEYVAGTSALSPQLRADLVRLLRRAVEELQEESVAVSPQGARRASGS